MFRPKYPPFFVLGLNDENAKRRHDLVIDLRGSVWPRNDDVVKSFIGPLAEKQPHPKRGFLLAQPAFEDVHKSDELLVQVLFDGSIFYNRIYCRN